MRKIRENFLLLYSLNQSFKGIVICKVNDTVPFKLQLEPFSTPFTTLDPQLNPLEPCSWTSENPPQKFLEYICTPLNLFEPFWTTPFKTLELTLTLRSEHTLAAGIILWGRKKFDRKKDFFQIWIEKSAITLNIPLICSIPYNKIRDELCLLNNAVSSLCFIFSKMIF